MGRCLTLGLLLVFVVCVSAQILLGQRPKKKVPEVDQRCMECICQASSNCDVSLRCHNSGGGGYFCGPYVISWAYWYDGGRPGDKGRAHDFENCLNNKTCAEEAVRGYMRKYGQDCDGSDAIDCYDFSRIHKLGFSSCGGEAIYDTDYWEKFEICYSGQPVSNNVGAPTYNNADAPTYNNAGAPTYNNADAPTYNNAGAPTYNNAGAPTYNNAGAPTYNNAGAPTYNNADAPTYNNADAPTYNNADAPTYNNADAPTYNNEGAPTYNNADAPTYNNADAPTYNNADGFPAFPGNPAVAGEYDYGEGAIQARNARN